MNGGFVSNAVCDTCNTVVPAETGLKDKLEAAFAETKASGIQSDRSERRDSAFMPKGVPAHAKHTDSWCQCGRCDI